jgi:predicted aldo/keto reductase-like oxidoreductase
MSINIRGIFSAMNMNLIYGNLQAAKGNYGFATKFQGLGAASECVACGQCESVCPQHLPIIENLKKVAGHLV